MSDQNKEIVRNFFAIQDREHRTPEELCASDFTAHLPGAPEISFEEFSQREAAVFDSFSNIQHVIEDMVAEDDRVAFRMRLEMTHTADFMGIPASNASVSIMAIAIMRLEDEKIAQFWGSPDLMGLMEQIGAGSA